MAIPTGIGMLMNQGMANSYSNGLANDYDRMLQVMNDQYLREKMKEAQTLAALASIDLLKPVEPLKPAKPRINKKLLLL